MRIAISSGFPFSSILGNCNPATVLKPLLKAAAYPCRWTQIEQMVQYRLYSAHDSRLCMWVALKLVEHYRPAAHRLWAVQGLAVELLEEPWPLLGGFHLLIMPLLTSEKGWISGKNVPQVRRAAARAAVGDVLERAHALRDSSGR